MKKVLPLLLIISLIATFLFTGVVSFAEESTVPHKGEYSLADMSEGHFDENGVATGYWMHPYKAGSVLSVEFYSPIWFCGFSFFAFSSPIDQYVDIEIVNVNDIVVWNGSIIFANDALQEVGFGKSLPEGAYTLKFILRENPDNPGGANQHFVLGSGFVRDDLAEDDIIVSGFKSSNSLGAPEIVLYEGDPDPDYVAPTPTATPETTDEPEQTPSDQKGTYALSDTSEGHLDLAGNAAGYWMHPFNIGDRLEVWFTTPIWMDGFQFFAWCPYCDVFLDIELLDEKEDIIWTGRVVCYGNEFNEVSFDKSFPPGEYTIVFVNAENPDFPEGINQHFVLGSGEVRADLNDDDIMVSGFLGCNTLGAPEIILYEGEADPNWVTPEPTVTPTATATATPTATPAETPDATESQADEVTESPKAGKGSGCGNLITGYVSLTMVAALAFVLKKKR